MEDTQGMFEPTAEYRTKVLRESFDGYEGPVFAVRFWDGWTWCSSATGAPECTIVLKNANALRELCAAPNEITLGEAFIHEDVDVEGDLFSVFQAAEHLFNRPRPLARRIQERLVNAGFAAW